jgi:hypothetical protein
LEGQLMAALKVQWDRRRRSGCCWQVVTRGDGQGIVATACGGLSVATATASWNDAGPRIGRYEWTDTWRDGRTTFYAVTASASRAG